MVYFYVIVIVQSIIFGFATKAVIRNKGYDDNWFWWGFCFGFIALIVACAKPQNIDYSFYNGQPSQPTYTSYRPSYGSSLSNAADKVRNEKLLAAGGWKCSCGRVHEPYVSSCTCGKSKSEVKDAAYKKKQEAEKKQVEEKKQAENMDEASKASAIKKYKELLDMGVITQEEFEAKKKQLLEV